MRFEELPEDDGLWFVKWIDEFRIPHLRTRSSSVSILIQRLSDTDPRGLYRLNRTDVAGRLAAKAEAGQSDKVTTLAGNIPHFAIGKVFQKQELVGELPARFDDIVLSSVSEPNFRIEVLSNAIEAPPGWNPKFDYRLINQSEYPELFARGFANSRCVVHEVSGTQYIIPLTIIFKCFYGFSERMANAFCKGPWVTTQSEIVYHGKMESGLETKDNKVDGTWDVVLQPKIARSDAHMLAALLFDPHARAQAESLYARAMRDRNFSKHNAWLCDAQIPFDTSIEPLRLRTKGYQLRKAWSKAPDKVLVSSIVSASFPPHFPLVRWEKFNSGETGQKIEYVDEPPPYSGAGNNRPVISDAEVHSDVDCDIGQGSANILADDFSWNNHPPLAKIGKSRSKRHLGDPGPRKPSQGSAEKLSSGVTTHQEGGLTEAQTRTLIRDPSNRLKHLMNAFEGLREPFKRNNHQFSYTIFGPLEPSMRAMHGGWPCWNFLDTDSRKTGVWPSRSWRLVEQRPKNDIQASGIPRCALVLEVDIDGHVGYWIEIETRANGNEGFRSPFIQTAENPIDTIEAFMEIIAQARGINLQRELGKAAKQLNATTVDCYKHHYYGDENSALDLNSVYNFLLRNVVRPQQAESD